MNQCSRTGDRPAALRHYRQWIEIRPLAGGDARRLELSRRIRVKLPTKKSTAPAPNLETLVAKDAEGAFEASDFETLRIVLRDAYPDQSFARTLHVERDVPAEQAFDDLIRLLVRASPRVSE